MSNHDIVAGVKVSKSDVEKSAERVPVRQERRRMLSTAAWEGIFLPSVNSNLSRYGWLIRPTLWVNVLHLRNRRIRERESAGCKSQQLTLEGHCPASRRWPTCDCASRRQSSSCRPPCCSCAGPPRACNKGPILGTKATTIQSPSGCPAPRPRRESDLQRRYYTTSNSISSPLSQCMIYFH